MNKRNKIYCSYLVEQQIENNNSSTKRHSYFSEHINNSLPKNVEDNPEKKQIIFSPTNNNSVLQTIPLLDDILYYFFVLYENKQKVIRYKRLIDAIIYKNQDNSFNEEIDGKKIKILTELITCLQDNLTKIDTEKSLRIHLLEWELHQLLTKDDILILNSTNRPIFRYFIEKSYRWVNKNELLKSVYENLIKSIRDIRHFIRRVIHFKFKNLDDEDYLNNFFQYMKDYYLIV